MGSPLSPKTLRVAGQALGFTDEAGDAIRQLSKPIRAYHGSPYDFDAFDASKIGSGEGAQTYGHGLYFAGNERVADQYRRRLAGDPLPMDLAIDGRPVFRESWQSLPPLHKDGANYLLSRLRNYSDAHAQEAMGEIGRDLPGLLEDAAAGAGSMERFAAERRLSELRGALDLLQNRRVSVLPPERPGHTYEVEIGHPEESLLDWDKPIYGQSDAVIDGLKRLNARALGAETELLDGAFGGLVWRTPRGNIVGTPTRNAAPETLSFWDTHQNHRHGGGAISDLNALKQSPTAASEALRSVGIPGIRYLDGGSRSAGEGTRNYVILPGAEDRIRILRKYGLLGPAAMAGTNSEEN